MSPVTEKGKATSAPVPTEIKHRRCLRTLPDVGRHVRACPRSGEPAPTATPMQSRTWPTENSSEKHAPAPRQPARSRLRAPGLPPRPCSLPATPAADVAPLSSRYSARPPRRSAPKPSSAYAPRAAARLRNAAQCRASPPQPCPRRCADLSEESCGDSRWRHGTARPAPPPAVTMVRSRHWRRRAPGAPDVTSARRRLYEAALGGQLPSSLAAGDAGCVAAAAAAAATPVPQEEEAEAASPGM
ncbi:uncharacterized protein LOC128897875 [Dryobates pubescens]|uniref:uncharacterized protein LOC128897875 n=1 Tax=Dryobates pubescens TaxID=118200 RepID=UPI0023B9BDE5|nr:uncharacterized protein LOC128897875 [Dryobates pubescens]